MCCNHQNTLNMGDCNLGPTVNRYMNNFGQEQWREFKWILRYLRGSSDMTLCYKGTDVRLHGYIDSDFWGDADSQKSTTGYVFTLGSETVSQVSRL